MITSPHFVFCTYRSQAIYVLNGLGLLTSPGFGSVGASVKNSMELHQRVTTGFGGAPADDEHDSNPSWWVLGGASGDGAGAPRE
jgi:hypothetical protein